MARVFDGFDERLERPVAVKILRPQTLLLPGMRTRFEQEALIAARLVHPNIVAVLDYGEDHTSSYLVMERLPGSTLRDEIVRGPLSSQRVVSVMSETLAALAAAHKVGVVHRDIKPGNILLHEDGHTKITDFGIAKSFGGEAGADRMAEDMTMAGVVLGTPGYLAPERRSGRPATVQSDLYSVGAVMVEALTGTRLAPGSEATEHLPRPFRDVARAALAVDPRDRFTSATDMLQALRARGAGGPASTPLPTMPMASRPVALPIAVPVVRRDRDPVLASSPAAPSRAYAATTTTDPRDRRRGPGGSRRHAVPLDGNQHRTQWTGRPVRLALRGRLAPLGNTPTTGVRPRSRRDQKPRGVALGPGVPRSGRHGRCPLCGGGPAAGGPPSGGGAGSPDTGPGAPHRRRPHVGAIPGRRERPRADSSHSATDWFNHSGAIFSVFRSTPPRSQPRPWR